MVWYCLVATSGIRAASVADYNVVWNFPEVAARIKAALLQWNAAMPKDAGDPSFAPAKDR